MTEEFIAQLGHALRGPGAAKRRLLTEAHTGLTEAAMAYRAAGLTEPAAADAALAEFGTVADVRAAFQAELDVAHTRRMAMLTVLTVPLFTVFWNVVWELNPYPTWTADSTAFALVVAASAVGWAASLPAAAVLVGTGRLGRSTDTNAVHERIPLLAAIATTAFAAATLTLPAVDPQTLVWPPTVAAVTTGFALVLMVAAAVRRGPHRSHPAC